MNNVYERLKNGKGISCSGHDSILGGNNPCAIVEELYNQIQDLQEQLKNLQSDMDYMYNINKHRCRLYNIWRKMQERCSDEDNPAFKNYGSRGILICEDWQRISGFYSFLIWALDNGYDKDLTIDRIDNSKGYSPDNCRWVNRVEQNNNTRKNKYLTAFGETDTMANMARKYNIDSDLLWSRINNGWNTEQALTTPARKGNYGKKSRLKELQGESK